MNLNVFRIRFKLVLGLTVLPKFCMVYLDTDIVVSGVSLCRNLSSTSLVSIPRRNILRLPGNWQWACELQVAAIWSIMSRNPQRRPTPMLLSAPSEQVTGPLRCFLQPKHKIIISQSLDSQAWAILQRTDGGPRGSIRLQTAQPQCIDSECKYLITRCLSLNRMTGWTFAYNKMSMVRGKHVLVGCGGWKEYPWWFQVINEWHVRTYFAKGEWEGCCSWRCLLRWMMHRWWLEWWEV